MRFGYVDGRHGQLHYRVLGEGDPLVLLPWAPSSGRMYAHLMEPFAARGFRVIAPDPPGYGRSHKNADGWTIGQMAEELALGLRELGVTSGYALGGHLSAAIVAELAIAEPQRWRRVVLDGSPTLTPAQMKALMSAFAGLSPALSPAGTHRTFIWDMTERFLREWDPAYHVGPDTLATQYAYMSDYLEMGYAPIRAFVDPSSRRPGGLATYDAIARWPLVTVPVLALTAEREALRPGHAAAVSLLRSVREHCFAGSHPLLDVARADEYAGVVTAFLRSPA